MSTYSLTAIIISLVVLIGYINQRLIRMQTTIAIMTGALLISLLAILAGNFGFPELQKHAVNVVSHINFHSLLMDGMLSFLLFAGGMSVDISELKSQKWEVAVLASAGTIISAVCVGGLVYWVLPLFGAHMPLIFCFLFGALISPTDPIAVLATFKKLGAPKELDVIVAGESLFNDGVGIVIFLTIYQLAFNNIDITWQNVSLLFLRQAAGGIVYGLVLGYLAHWLIRPIRDDKLAIFITLLVTTGGYQLAQSMAISGPLAMVVAGIIIGNISLSQMPLRMRASLSNFWELIDEILNAVLFLLIGFELLTINFNHTHLAAALFAIPLVLVVRSITVGAPMACFKLKSNYPRNTISILIWGGLRGGLAVALALALPQSHYRSLILSMTYGVVAFAIIVQGLTIKGLVTRASH